MPELPEVETLRRSLLPFLPTPVIKNVDIMHPSVIFPSSESEFRKNLVGKSIIHANRRGKYLVLVLSPQGSLVIHLRMTGQFFYRPPKNISEKIPHTHVMIHFEDGSAFHYADVRRFGRICYYETQILDSGYCALGPEPFDDRFNLEYLRTLGKRKAPIKSILLQQHLIAGLGNIYADEALFRARIHPLRGADSLSDFEWFQLYQSIRSVITEAVEARGSSISDYLDANRQKGSFQTHWSVYQKTSSPCVHCGAPIQRTKIAGRSSHFCPVCQPQFKNNPPSIIGITGGIASGKSTVVSYIKTLGATVIDADEISRSLTAENGPALPMIFKEFGQEYASAPGVLNRQMLADLVFTDATARQKLNDILHPMVLREIQNEIAHFTAVKSPLPLFLDIPLLFEANLEFLCDQIWLVYVDEATQRNRLMARNSLTQEQAMKRMKAQIPLEHKRLNSNHIIDNNGNITETQEQVDQLWKLYGFPIQKEE